MVAVHHLRFEIQFFNSRVVKSPILHRHSKYREDQSDSCWDILILVIFEMVAAAILDSEINIFNGWFCCMWPVCVIVPDFIKIWQTVQRYGDLTVFYRTMLCIRDTSHGPVSVRLSVSLSVTSRSSTKTAKRRITQTPQRANVLHCPKFH